MSGKWWNLVLRIIIISLLVVILYQSGYYFSSTKGYKESYPTGKDIKPNMVGDTVHVYGIVVSTYDQGFFLRDIYQDSEVIYRVQSSFKPKPGETVNMLGVLGPDYTITSISLNIVHIWDLEFMILTSIFGLILFLILFLRNWTFNWHSLEFRRR